jgi:ubiquitin carboxyl-terminal hydrolase 7
MVASASQVGGKKSVGSAAVSPVSFCRTMGIPVFEQQDSQEFWKLLLPALNLPPLTDLYQGAFEDYLVALDGSDRERRREEAFLDLSLDVVRPGDGGGNGNDGNGSGSNSFSVVDGLRSMFGRPELLSASDGNGWKPERGADPVDAHKGYTLKAQGLPPVLQLHLKRFQYDWNTDTTRKINDPVSFPLALDLTELCQKKESSVTSNDSDDALTYDLQAIVVHAGEYGSGHYYAYVRPDVRSDQWYRFNDHIVDAVSYSEVYVDARGGKAPVDSSSAIQDESQAQQSKRPGWFWRLWGRVHRASGKDPYGYGGRTSNAYVLQYVKRSDVPMLYNA